MKLPPIRPTEDFVQIELLQVPNQDRQVQRLQGLHQRSSSENLKQNVSQ